MGSDYMMRQIEDITRCIATIVFGRKVYRHEEIAGDSQRSEAGFLFYRLRSLLADREINEAENLLFEAVEANPTEEYLSVALDFYEELHAMTDAQLEAADFSRAEILEGLRQLRRIYGLTVEDTETNTDTEAEAE